MAPENASTSTPGMRTYTPILLTTIRPISAAILPGRGPDKKEPQLNPSSSCEEVGLCVLLAVGVLRDTPSMTLFPELLPFEGVGGVSGTFGFVSVSDSVACAATNLLRLAGASGRRMFRLRMQHTGCRLAPERVKAAADCMLAVLMLLENEACCLLPKYCRGPRSLCVVEQQSTAEHKKH